MFIVLFPPLTYIITKNNKLCYKKGEHEKPKAFLGNSSCLLCSDSLAERANITIRDLRRTFGSNCVMDGVSLPTVQIWMGHASIETTIKHYGHKAQSFRKEEIRKIEGRMDTCVDTEKIKKDYETRNPLKNNGAPCMIRTCGPRFRKPIGRTLQVLENTRQLLAA